MTHKNRFKRFFIPVLFAVGVTSLGGCMTTQTTNAGAVGVTRKQFVMVSEQEVEASANKAYADVLAQASKAGKLNQNSQEVKRVRSIVNRLIPQTAVFRADAPGWDWQVNVITSNEVNAWCMAGGKIAVYTGLLEKIKPTDAELAAVLGHEIGHALREHSRERISRQMATDLGLNILAAGFGLSSSASNLANQVLNVTVALPYSREDETEADRIGVELAARAGYDPRAAISLWRKMEQLGGGAPPEILSTHPSPERRMQDLEYYSQKVLPLYEQARKR